MKRPELYFLPATFVFAALVLPVQAARGDRPKIPFCETLLEKGATGHRAFQAGIPIEHPFHVVPVLTPKALKIFGLEPRTFGTNMRAQFVENTAGKAEFQIVRAGGKVAFRGQLSGQPLYNVTLGNEAPGMTYAVLDETAEGVRAVLAVDDFSGGSYYVASIDVPCERVGEFLNGPLLETDEPLHEIRAHGDVYCRIPVLTLFRDLKRR